MRFYAYAVGAAVMLAGCSAAVPGQPAPQAFHSQFLNLASVADQVANMTNIGINTQVNVPVVVSPITQVSTLSDGAQNADPTVDLPISQGMNLDVSQLMSQWGATL